MPLDYPPELICNASCNNPECFAEVGVTCQYGDDHAQVEAKLKSKGWLIVGDKVYCSERCRIRHASSWK